MTRQNDIEKFIKEHLHNALFSIENPKPFKQGKVRDLYFLKDQIILVASDRVSAFDHVFGTIPLKGALLTEQSNFWFEKTKDICPNHLLDRIDHQVLLCKNIHPLPLEIIVRGFLAGSMLRENKYSRGEKYGLKIDPEMKPFEQFTKPIITPSTKAPKGQHDQPISAKEIIKTNLVNQKTLEEVSEIALSLFKRGQEHSLTQGLHLVDTKYEFGILENKIFLIDEIHTCDSSRFFSTVDYEEKFAKNQAPKMYDKEFLRRKLLDDGLDPQGTDFSNISLGEKTRIELSKRYFQITEAIIGKNYLPPKQGAQQRISQKLSQVNFC